MTPAFILKIRSGGCKLSYKYLEDERTLLKDCKRKWLDQEPDITDLYHANLTSLIDSAIEKISIMLTKLKKDSADYIVINHFENCDSLHSYGGGCMMGGSFPGRPGNCTCSRKYWDYFEQKILKEGVE